MRSRAALAVTTCLCAALAATSPAASASAPGDPELIVKFSAEATRADRSELRGSVGATVEDTLASPGLQLLDLPAAGSPAAAENLLERSDLVEYVEVNGIVAHFDVVPNDPLYAPYQWGLNNTGAGVLGGTADADIDAAEAWNTLTGSPIVVGVLDTGVLYSHEDVSTNIWLNAGESGGGKETNGVDDDGNGQVDDFRGYDFENEDNNPIDDHSHGTHVASTIGSPGNNAKGVAGVNWGAKLMAVKIGSAAGITIADELQGLTYAVQNGAKVLNGSYGGSVESLAVKSIVDANPTRLFVFAAGNDGTNNDVMPQYPCSTTSANIICVAASNNFDQMASFSNYGATSVDLAAPGDDIAAAVNTSNSAYALKSGTSMATPMVVGAVSMVWGQFPALTAAQVKAAILGSTDPLVAGCPTVTNGRLNLSSALAEASLLDAPGAQPQSTGCTSTPSSPGPSLPPAVNDTVAPVLGVVSSKRAKLGSRGIVRFSVTCDESCSVAVSARPNVAGMPAMADTATGSVSAPAKVALKFRKKRLKQLRSVLRKKKKVKLFVAVVATDVSGNKSGPKIFTVTLSR